MSKPRKFPNENIIKHQGKEINELRNLCSEMYQVLGQFGTSGNGDPLGLEKLLDALSAAANGEGFHPKQSLLPWHLPKEIGQALERYAAIKQLEKLHIDDVVEGSLCRGGRANEPA